MNANPSNPSSTTSTETTDGRREYQIQRRTFWVSVVASIVASVLFGLFFESIVRGISNATVSTIGVFYSGYVDKLYADAAQSPADYLIFMVFGMIMGLPILVFVGMSLSLLILRATGQTQRRVGLLLGCTMPMLMIALLIIVAGPAVSITANATFQRRMMALVPVMSQDERKSFLGKWALINSKDDYLHLNTELDALAMKHHITLPRRAQ